MTHKCAKLEKKKLLGSIKYIYIYISVMLGFDHQLVNK